MSTRREWGEQGNRKQRMPIDINLLRAFKGGLPDLVKLSQTRRFANPALVDEVIALDNVEPEKSLDCVDVEKACRNSGQHEQGEAFAFERSKSKLSAIRRRLERNESKVWKRLMKRRPSRISANRLEKCKQRLRKLVSREIKLWVGLETLSQIQSQLRRTRYHMVVEDEV